MERDCYSPVEIFLPGEAFRVLLHWWMSPAFSPIPFPNIAINSYQQP